MVAPLCKQLFGGQQDVGLNKRTTILNIRTNPQPV